MSKTFTFLLFLLTALPSPAQDRWVNFTSTKSINRITLDGDHLWAATTGGVINWDTGNGTYEKYTTAEGLPHNFVRTVAVDPDGNKWFGTEAGLARFDGMNWTVFTSDDGLAHTVIAEIAFDADGNKWFGSWGGGISRYDGENWTTYSINDGLADIYIYSIAFEPDGTVWAGTRNGVSKFNGTDWTTFTTSDGLSGIVVYSVAIDTDGNKWFGTNNEDGQPVLTIGEGCKLLLAEDPKAKRAVRNLMVAFERFARESTMPGNLSESAQRRQRQIDAYRAKFPN